MTEHPSTETLELYAMGAHDELDPALTASAWSSLASLEAHLASCTTCAARLAREARLELALYAAAEDGDRCPACLSGVDGTRCDHCGAALAPHGYRTRALLSQSPQGRVYAADAPDGTRVALKELVFTQVPDLRTVEAFEREGRVLRQLDHEHIPRYLDSFVDGDGVNMRFYLAQSYVEGDSLEDILTHRRFTEAEVRNIGRQVLEVLYYLQEISPQVIHRDLKPGNLIQRADGTMVLVDFGSARERGATVGGTFAGTFGYAPPEQLVGIVDSSSDVYALGVTLIQLLTRVAPWSMPLLTPAVDKAQVSPPMRRWLARMTAADPRERFASAHAALAALDALERRPAKARWPMIAAIAAAVSVPGMAAFWASTAPVAPATISATPSPTASSGAGTLPKLETDPRTLIGPSATTTVTRTGTRALPLPVAPRPSPVSTPRPSPRPLPSAPPAAAAVTITQTSTPAAPDPKTDDCTADPRGIHGYVTIDTVPYSEIFWGTQKLGDTPLAKQKLPPGCIELRARSHEGLERRFRVRIDPYRTLRYRVDLEQPE